MSQSNELPFDGAGVVTKELEMARLAYLVGLGDLADMAQKVMDDREIYMFYTLKRMSEIPEGPTISFETICAFYSLIRVLSETTLRHDRFLNLGNDYGTRDRKHRLHSALLLVSALQAIELETEGKGEIIRMYDQTRRTIIASYNREVEHLKQDYARL